MNKHGELIIDNTDDMNEVQKQLLLYSKLFVDIIDMHFMQIIVFKKFCRDLMHHDIIFSDK